MAVMRIEPARLDWQADGTPHSPDYADVYHSSDGGPGQARHVFLAGNDLPARWAGRERFVILENGFGTGLNFLATWAAWRQQSAAPRLHYLAVEKHPFSAADLARLHPRWPEFAELAAQLRGQWPLPLAGFHRLEFEQGGLVLSLLFGETAHCLGQLLASVDAFYLDGFDPKKNPAMWSPAVLRECARLAAPGATLSTWCVAAQVRAALSQAGFHLDKRPGFGRKREMLVGHAPGKSATAEPRERHALIVGAGLAGCATAERLATRGWQIDLIERNAEPSQEGSGNHAGIVRPLLARNDSIAARLNRACFLHTLRAWAALDGSAAPVRRGFNGVAHIARDADMAAQQAQMAADFPAEFAHFMRRDELAAKLGQPVLFGGLWFPLGGWAQPPSAARALRAACGERLRLHKHRAVAALHRVEGRWQARDANGAVIAQAPQLILATGAATAALDLTAGLPINRVRGQVSHLPAGSIPAIEAALCSEGYLTPAVDGIHCLGASYVHDDGCELRVSESAENLQRLARILPGAETRLDAAALAGRVGFRATTGDRLPLIGALPEAGLTADPGLPLADIPRLANAYALLGLGSRGLVWAMLAAETLASQIEAEPLPLEAELIAATDPARFLRQKKRR